MRLNLVDLAREHQSHPSDVARLVSESQLSVWKLSDGSVVVDWSRPIDLSELQRYQWIPLPQWADENGTYYRRARRLLSSGELVGIDDGHLRRWALSKI